MFLKKTQKGGHKLGQGSYGCVITPPIECKSNLLRNNPFENNDKYVSKIIKTTHSSVAFSELNIGIKIHNIDKEHNYFVPYINACYFTPQKNLDIIYLSKDGKYISSNPDSFNQDSSYTRTQSEDIHMNSDISTYLVKQHYQKCILRKDSDYLNLIGVIGGDNLSNILINSKNNNKIQFIKNNYGYILYYLIKGLSLLHNHKIIHKDIKPSNLIIDFLYNNNIWNQSKKYEQGHYKQVILKSRLRYIDFGLALFLNKKKYSNDEILNLLSNGTSYYIPMEIFAIKILYKLIRKGYNPNDKLFLYIMMTKMKKTFQKNSEYYHHEGIRHNNIILKNNLKKKVNSEYYLTTEKYEKTFEQILELYKSNTLNTKINDFLYYWDIYSLGIVLCKIIINTNIENHTLNNIVFKMIDLNYEKRIKINELLNYFDKIDKTIILNY
jgi:serine/threonine protein kinase